MDLFKLLCEIYGEDRVLCVGDLHEISIEDFRAFAFIVSRNIAYVIFPKE